jgi:hypothetical protein
MTPDTPFNCPPGVRQRSTNDKSIHSIAFLRRSDSGTEHSNLDRLFL